MAVKVQDGGLYFDSGIDLTGLEADAKKADNIIAGIGKSVPTSQFQSLNAELGKVQHNIETLRAMKLARENFLINETDISKIAKYRQEITVLEKEIQRLSNIGREGFDALGNPIKNLDAIGKSAEKAAGGTNVLTKSWSFLRQAAYLIPGIGIAGIFNLIGEGAVKLATNLFSAKRGLEEVKTKADLLAEAQSKIAAGLAEGEAKFRPYLDALKNANLSEQDRVDIYNKLKSIDPQIVAGIDAKTLSYQRLASNVNVYLDALRNQLKLEANKEAVIASIKQEQAIQKQIDDTEKLIAVRKEANKGFTGVIGGSTFANTSGQAESDANLSITQNRLDNLKKQLTVQKQVTESIGKDITSSQDHQRRTVDVIDKEIATLKQQQTALSATSKEYLNFQQQINKLEEERKAIVGATKSEIKAVESEFNKLLQTRKDLLQSIENVKRDAFQSGLVKEQSEVDKIREKYDLLIGKVNEFNKKASTQKIPGISLDAVTQARDLEISNTIQKQQANDYIKNIETQKAAFDDFEKYKLSVGPDNAKLIVDEQIKTFDSYIDFIQAKLKELANDNSIGAQIKKDALSKLLEKAKTDKQKQDQADQAKALQDVLSLTGQYEFQKNQVEQRFAKMREALQKSETTMTKEEFQKRSSELERLHQKELTNLQNTATRQSQLYQKLGEDVINFSREQLKQRVAELKNTLKNDTSLTPQMQKDVQSAIDNLENLIIATDETINKLSDFIEKGSKIKTALEGLGTALDPFSKQLGDAIKGMSQLLGDTLQVAQGLKDFDIANKKGDAAGQIAAGASIATAIADAIQGVISDIQKLKKSKKDTEADLLEFQTKLITGEQEYQALLRERAKQTVLNNKLTLQGLIDQQRLLEQQKQTTSDAFKNIFSQLQNESFVKDLTEAEKKNFSAIFKGFSGIFGSKTIETKQILESLSGKSFDQLEELFTKGQLTGKAKELFEALQKIKQEGVDIDALLEENRQKAAEIFTGTTADSILDAITEGFSQGKRSVADFASTFEDFMRQAILNSLKYKYLEGPVKELFDQFATKTESGAQLTKAEIDDLRNKYNAIIKDASTKFDQLQQIAGINFNSLSGSNQNVLVGQFQQMSEDTGNLLVGQFNGQRMATLQLVDIQKNALSRLTSIDSNTFNTVIELRTLVGIFKDSQSGARRLNVNI